MFQEVNNMSNNFFEDQGKELQMFIQPFVKTENIDSLQLVSNMSTPEYVQGRNFFLPDFEAENPFFSSITRNLIRNSSFDYSFEQYMNSDLLANKKASEDLGSFNELEIKPERCELNLGLEPSAEQSHQDTRQDELFEFPMNNLFELESSEPADHSTNQEATSDYCEILDEKSCTGKFSPDVIEIASLPSEKIKKILKKKIQKTKPVTKQEKKKKAKTNKKKASSSKAKEMKETKNIIKNYGKAMAAFSLSEAALPYLNRFLPSHGVTLEEYKNFMINKKETIDSISSLRDAIFANPELDDEQEARLKGVFRDISEVFVQDFAVNWIFSCRSQYKAALLSYRFKILRRVRDPASFTYLKTQ